MKCYNSGIARAFTTTGTEKQQFAACNSKNNNFSKNKLNDRIKWLNGHIEEYLRILDEADR